MKLVDKDKLDKISGGSDSISGTVINAVVSLIKLLHDAGYALGSGIRRLAEDEICPLE